MSSITDGAELVFHVLGQPETLGLPYDLGRIPPKMQEVERKYTLHAINGHNDGGSLRFASKLDRLIEERRARIVKDVPFDGIDEYYIVKKSDNEQITLRYRAGSNRMPQLTMKFQFVQDDNEVRGEINLDVRGTEPDAVRAFLTAVSRFGGYKPQQFAVRQTGHFWVIKDPEVGTVEVVSYKVAGINPNNAVRSFAEIEAVKWDEVEKAIQALDTYEKGLGLTEDRCHKSIADLFGSGVT